MWVCIGRDSLQQNFTEARDSWGAAVTQSRSRVILDRAKADPKFREKLIRVGGLRDQFTYPGAQSWLQLAPALLEFAGDAGLMEQVDSQYSVDELLEWLLENVDELAFYAADPKKLVPGRYFQKPVGKVFVSWTVKNARGRASMLAIKHALDYCNIEYFDYTEHQLDDRRDVSEQIIQQLDSAISRSDITMEAMSSGVGSAWLQWERDRIAKSAVKLRVFACLETELASHMELDPSEEERVIRADISGGRSGVVAMREEDVWEPSESDTSYFRSEAYYFLCFALIWNIRRRLGGDKPQGWFERLRDTVTFRRPRAAFDFVRLAMKQ